MLISLQVQVFFRRVESSLHISIAYLTLLKYGVYILTIKHFSACIWFYIACYSEFRSVGVKKLRFADALRTTFLFSAVIVIVGLCCTMCQHTPLSGRTISSVYIGRLLP